MMKLKMIKNNKDLILWGATLKMKSIRQFMVRNFSFMILSKQGIPMYIVGVLVTIYWLFYCLTLGWTKSL